MSLQTIGTAVRALDYLAYGRRCRSNGRAIACLLHVLAYNLTRVIAIVGPEPS